MSGTFTHTKMIQFVPVRGCSCMPSIYYVTLFVLEPTIFR